MKAEPVRPAGRLPAILLAGPVLIAAALGYRTRHRPPPPGVPLIARARVQLALAPVLAAEASLRARPDDPSLRFRLATAGASAGDPAGAALALYSLIESPEGRQRRPGLVAPFVLYCAQVGWWEEALAILPGDSRGGLQQFLKGGAIASPAHTPPSGTLNLISPTRVILDLAAACATHGEAPRAASLLAALERGTRAELGADEWLDGAMTWYQCRRPQVAGEWARRGAAKQPEHPAAQALLARCLLAAGQPEVALAALPSHSLTPSLPHSLIAYWRARAELRCGSMAQRHTGLDFLARLGLAEPPDPVAAFEAGRAFLNAGQPGRAAPLLSRAARAQYQEVLANEMLARAYAALGHASAAVWAQGRVERARGQFAAAEASLRRSAAIDPSPAGVYLDLSAVLLLRDKAPEALELLQRARKAHPDSLELALAEAEALNHLDRFADQARVLEDAATRFPARGWETLRDLGKMYDETRQFDRVVPSLERALPGGDGDAEVHRFLGLGYALHPENPALAARAVDHLLRAAALDSREDHQWTTAAALLQRMGYPSETAACCRRAIDAVSESDGPYFALAQLLQRQGRPAEVRLLLRLYRQKRTLQTRRRQWENRISANRGDAAAHYALGDLLLRNGDYRAAYPYLLIAASLRPQWKPAQLRLADACTLLDYVDLWQQAEGAAAR
jgi:tetratricopeptide (TPR) repeat protein